MPTREAPSTRRRFLIGGVSAAAASTTIATLARAWRFGAARVADREPRYDDCHAHLGQMWGNRKPLDAKGLLYFMDAHGIERAVVLPLISPEAWDHPLSTDFVLRETLAHRDRLIPFCSIDPRTINLPNFEAKKDLLKRYRDAGARGFGEHKPGVAIDDPRNLELFRACAELQLPMLLHLDTHRNVDQPGLPGFEKVLKEIPEGTFIAHAQGFWASISGELTAAQMQGYPKGAVHPHGAIDRLMDAHPNLYGDLSAGSGANAIGRDPAFGKAFLERRQERLLFGTDYLAPGQLVPQFELFESLGIESTARESIFRGNARRLFPID